MNITTKLTLNALLPAVLAFTVLTGILLMNREIGKAQNQVSSVTGIKDGILKLNLLTSAYLLDPSRRNDESWRDHFNDSAAALNRIEFTDPARRELLFRMRRHFADAAALFSRLVASYTGRQPGTGPARLSPVQQRLVQELRVNDRFIASDAASLAAETNNNLDRKLRLGTILTALFTVLMAGAVICIQLKINGRIKNAIDRLRKGTDRIASGDLDHKVGTTAADETGELGRAFDRMAGQLRLTLVSRDELRREIEERMRVEDELRTSEENYRAIFDSVNDAIFVHDIETGNVVSVNSRTEEMYGRPAGEFRDFLSESLFSGVPGFTAQEALQRIRRAAAGEPQLFEWLSKKKTGELFWVEVNLKRAVIGGETRLLAVVRDISDRKRTEEALNLTQFSVDHASVSAFLVAKDARFLYVNEQTCRNLGYAREELLRMTAADIDSGIRLSAWPARWEQIKREGSLRFERMHRKKDGTLMPVEITANFVAFGGKEYNWAFAVDMTERKLAEQKLQESEVRFRQLAENTDQVFWFMRPDPEQVLYVSPAVERIWGVHAEDMYRNPRLWTRMIHPDDRDAVETVFSDWLAGRASGFDREYRIVRSDGGVRWIRDRGTLIRDGRGRVVRASGIADDITGRKKAEQELRRAKELLEEAQQIAGIGNWEWDRETDRLIWSNEVYRIFGVLRAEFKGTLDAYMDMVLPQDRQHIKDRIAEASRERKEASVNEYRIRRPDGTIRTVYTQSRFQYSDEGNLAGMRGTVQDVTEARRAEESLKLVQFSMDHASVAAFIIRPDASIMYANDQASSGLGYSREELASLTIPDLDPNFPASKWGGHWEELKKKGFLHFESAHRRKDGKLVPMDISVNYLSFRGREYNVGFALDISERKQAEDSLKQSFKLTATILDSINDPISLIDVRDFTLVRVNKVFLQRYGYSDQSEITGKHCYEVTHHRPDVCSPPHDICPLIETVKTQDHFSVDHVHYDNHGEKVYVEVSTSPVRDQAGNVTQVVHVQRDITERKKAEESLRLSEARFRNLFRQSSLSMQILSPDGASIEVNRAFEQLWEVNADALKGYNILQDEQLVSLGIMGYIRKAFGGEATEIPVTRYDPGTVSPGSRERWVKGFIYPVAAGSGAIHDLVLMHVDVSDMVKTEEALRESEERFRAFFESAAAGAAELDPDTRRFLRVNDRLCEITGYSRAELLSKTVPDITHPQDRQPDSTAFARARAGMVREHRIEKRYVCKDGRIVWVQVSGSIIRDVRGRPVRVAGVIQDITERKRMEDEIRHLAHHDALTGLPNRRLFVQILNVELALTKRHGNRLAVLFLDLDRFKEINDRYGHAIGDELLKTVAKRFRNIIRMSDTVARIGGDEFNIVLTNLSRPDDISEIAMKITNSFRKPAVVDGHELAVTTSIGISIYPDDSGDLNTLIQYADAAMYAAKEGGRNRFKFYNASIDVLSAERARFESYLAHAIERDELLLEYQPQIDASTGTIASVEALVRWKHPELGLLGPGKFLEAADDTGYITEIDQWVLRTACSQVKAWRDAGLARFSLAVNLSARQFERPELAATVIRILGETGMPPDCLTLEISESALRGGIERTAAHLKELTDQGVRISVDDYGTGQSSLNHLKRLPIERVKIDRSFIRGIATDPEDRAVINAMTAMARSLRIRVVAEGVETEDQRAFVKKAGCEEMQGYLFGRPVSAAAMTDSLLKKT